MAKDIYHDQVKIALQRDGWRITHEPYSIRIGGVEMYIDMGGEKIIGAEKENVKIAVEIKSFTSPSSISDFHLAHGQFLDYRYALEEIEPDRILYLAVPFLTYQSFFSLKFIQKVIEKSQLKLFVYDSEQECVVKWIR